MPPKKHPWLRFYVEAPWDPKIRRLDPLHCWVWTVMLTVARSSPRPGELLLPCGGGDVEPVGAQHLADASRVSVGEVEKGLEAMKRLGLVEEKDDNVLVVPKWSERQYESDTSSDRVREHRQRDATPMQRRSNGDGTAPENREQITPPVVPPLPKRRSVGFPDGWSPNDKHRELATSLGLDIDPEAAHFEDHHRAKGSTFRDWNAAFSSWLRNARKFSKGHLRAVGDAYKTPDYLR